MITLDGEKKLSQPLKIRLTIALTLIVTSIPVFFLREAKSNYRWAGLVTFLFGSWALFSKDMRNRRKSKNPLFNKYLEMIALGLMFGPHLWLLRIGQAADIIHVDPFRFIFIPTIVFIEYILCLSHNDGGRRREEGQSFQKRIRR